jgi:hypothetical protein
VIFLSSRNIGKISIHGDFSIDSCKIDDDKQFYQNFELTEIFEDFGMDLGCCGGFWSSIGGVPLAESPEDKAWDAFKTVVVGVDVVCWSIIAAGDLWSFLNSSIAAAAVLVSDVSAFGDDLIVDASDDDWIIVEVVLGVGVVVVIVFVVIVGFVVVVVVVGDVLITILEVVVVVIIVVDVVVVDVIVIDVLVVDVVVVVVDVIVVDVFVVDVVVVNVVVVDVVVVDIVVVADVIIVDDLIVEVVTDVGEIVAALFSVSIIESLIGIFFIIVVVTSSEASIICSVLETNDGLTKNRRSSSSVSL